IRTAPEEVFLGHRLSPRDLQEGDTLSEPEPGRDQDDAEEPEELQERRDRGVTDSQVCASEDDDQEVDDQPPGREGAPVEQKTGWRGDGEKGGGVGQEDSRVERRAASGAREGGAQPVAGRSLGRLAIVGRRTAMLAAHPSPLAPRRSSSWVSAISIAL